MWSFNGGKINFDRIMAFKLSHLAAFLQYSVSSSPTIFNESYSNLAYILSR